MKELQLLIKPVSSACDLQCRYCFYKEEVTHRQKADCGIMSWETMEILIDKALKEAERCVFGFQGGEPLLAGISFYRRFTSLVSHKKREGQQIYYTIQTNGVALDDKWIEFFKKEQFLLGISLDGVRRTHDENRVDHKGEGTFEKVFDNLNKLKEQKVPFHILCVLNAQTAERIEAIYRFFMKKGFYEQQYIPCLDPLGEVEEGKYPYSLTVKQYQVALQHLFDLWFEDKVRGIPVYIRQFDNYVAMLGGGQPEACSMYGKCSMQNIIEADGTIYPCDFYALDEYRMGNITDPAVDFKVLKEMSRDPQKAPFFTEAEKRDERCRLCRWYPLCRGGCRRDLIPFGDRSRNRYCEAYQQFFQTAIGRLEYLVSYMYLKKL